MNDDCVTSNELTDRDRRRHHKAIRSIAISKGLTFESNIFEYAQIFLFYISVKAH